MKNIKRILLVVLFGSFLLLCTGCAKDVSSEKFFSDFADLFSDEEVEESNPATEETENEEGNNPAIEETENTATDEKIETYSASIAILSLSGQVITWEPDINSMYYALYYKKGDEEICLVNNITSSTYDFNKGVTLQAGIYNVYVKPVIPDKKVTVSNPQTVSIVKLSAPVLKKSMGYLIWDVVSGADYYDIYIGGEYAYSVTEPKIPLSGTQGKEFTVVAKSDKDGVVDSEFSQVYKSVTF